MSTITAGNVTVSCSLSADTTGNLVFQSGGNVTAMTIDTSQNVGIGTSSPAPGMRLAVVGGGTQISGGTSAQAGLRVQVASGVATLTGINNDNNAYNPIAFYTGASEAARIDSSGNFLVGTTSAPVHGNKMRVQGGIETQGSPQFNIVNTGAIPFEWVLRTGTGMDFYVNNANTKATLTSSGVWTNASDARYKENIRPITYGIAQVMELKPRVYNMIGSEKQEIGFVAQEVQPVLPELVDSSINSITEEERMTLSYGQMSAVLVKAIQEQQQMIEELKAEVAALKGASA